MGNPQNAEGMGKAAFEALLPRLRAIPAEDVITPRADVAALAIAVVPIARRAASAPMRDRFAMLPPQLFDIRHVDDLETIARAARYARNIHVTATATRPSEARVPTELVDRAVEVRGRMLSLVTYWFARDAALKAEVDDIRAGQGHADLAQDLNRLARLYREQHATVSRDPLNYVEGDADLADRLAEQIFDELGLSARSRPATADDVARAWTLLRNVYDEVAATGRWLFRNEDGEASFPALFALRRSPSRGGNAGKAEDEDGGAEKPAEAVAGAVRTEPETPTK
jgi:hypothetical protein